MSIIDFIRAANIELPVTFHEESGFQPDKTVSIICDRADVERIKSQSWQAMRDSLGNTTLFTNVCSALDPIYLPLQNYLMSLDNSVSVLHINGRTDDFRKSNLVRYR